MLTQLLENYLPAKRFFRIHRSFAVNFSHVAGFDKKTVTMDNGDVLPCSRMKEFKAALDFYNFNSF